jgi:hypothetical protein
MGSCRNILENRKCSDIMQNQVYQKHSPRGSGGATKKKKGGGETSLTCVHIRKIFCLFVWLFISSWAISQLPSECSHYRWQDCNLDLFLALMVFSNEGSFPCHTCCDTEPRLYGLIRRTSLHSGIRTCDVRIIRSCWRRSNRCMRHVGDWKIFQNLLKNHWATKV